MTTAVDAQVQRSVSTALPIANRLEDNVCALPVPKHAGWKDIFILQCPWNALFYGPGNVKLSRMNFKKPSIPVR